MSSPTTRPIFTPEVRFQQYRLMVEIVMRANDRRDHLQTGYVILHAAALAVLAAGLGVLSSSGAARRADLAVAKSTTLSIHPTTPIIVIVVILGVLLSVIWRGQLNALRKVSVARYQMLFNMELDLPYQIFMQEWERLGKGRYLTDTTLQRVAPLIAALLYLILAAAYLLPR